MNNIHPFLFSPSLLGSLSVRSICLQPSSSSSSFSSLLFPCLLPNHASVVSPFSAHCHDPPKTLFLSICPFLFHHLSLFIFSFHVSSVTTQNFLFLFYILVPSFPVSTSVHHVAGHEHTPTHVFLPNIKRSCV